MTRNKESGQAMVETAIIIPLFIFILLGILQMGLIYQAKVLLKYAAYRAARTGPIPFLRGQACPLFAHVGVYAYRKPFLEALTAMPSTPLELAESLEQLRVLENGHKIRTVLTAHSSIGVDTPDDLLQAEARMRQLIARGEMG